MEQRDELILVLWSLTFLILAITIVILYVLSQRRRNKLMLRQKEAEKKFEQEISLTKIEIREQTLRNISWELHDNIGQLLTLAKIQLNRLPSDSPEIIEVRETLSKSLSELRSLSKLINPDAIRNIGLSDAVKLEMDRFNRLNYISANFNLKGEVQKLDAKVEVVLFRILQEFFNNTLKHAKASELSVTLEYQTDQLIIIAADNGKGFDTTEGRRSGGIGLDSMQKRGELINARITLNSEPDKGTTLNAICKY